MSDRRSDAFLNGRYESPDTLSSVDIDLPPMLGNPVNPYDGASSVNTGRSRSGEYYVDAVPGSTPPPSSSQSYLHCPRQSLKRRSVNTLMNDVSEQIQGKPGQAAPISAPRMKHPIMPTLSQISSCDVKSIIICILVAIIMTTSMWDTVTLPQPGTYICFLAGSVPIALFAYMFYLLLQDHKRQGSESYQDRRDDPLPTRNVVPPSVVSSLSTASSDKSSLYNVDIVLSSLCRRIGAAASSIARFSAWGPTPYGEGQSAEQQEGTRVAYDQQSVHSVGSLPSIPPSHRHISPSSLTLDMNGLSLKPRNMNVQEVMRFFRNNKDWLMNLQIGFESFIDKLSKFGITGEDVFDSKNFNETFLEEHLKVKQGMGRKRLMKLVKKLRESYPVMKAHAADHKTQDNTGVSIKQGDHNTNNVNNVHHHYSGKINTINHHPSRFAHGQGPQGI